MLVAVIGAAILALSGCRTPLLEPLEPPDVSLVSLAPEDGGPFEQRVRVVLRLTNPNNEDLEFEGLRFQLELNERPFTRGVSNESVTVPRLGEATVEVIATTTLIDWVRQIGALTDQRDLDFPYALEGRLFLANSTRSMDFSRSGRLGE